MACELVHRPRILFVALVAVLVALWIPATGHAAERDRLASAGRAGAGFRLRRAPAARTPFASCSAAFGGSGDRPGPIDGLYGPLTQGAVRALPAAAWPGGRRDRRPPDQAVAVRRDQPAHRVAAQRDTQPGTLTRKSPARASGSRAQVSSHTPGPLPAGAASRDGPASGTSGIPPELIAALAALAGLMLVLTLRKQGEVRLNFGLTCAALLGVFGIGAVAGALFATRAAPKGSDGATARVRHPARGRPGARPRTAHHRGARRRSIRIPMRHIRRAAARRPNANALGERRRASRDPLRDGTRIRVARTRGHTGRSHRSGGPRRSACAADGRPGIARSPTS